MTTPANWKPGDDVVVHASVPTEEARKIFPNLVEHKVSMSQFSSQPAYVNAFPSVVLPQDHVAACITAMWGELELKIMVFCIVVQ